MPSQTTDRELNAVADAETFQEQARTPLLPLRWSTISSRLCKRCISFTASIGLQTRGRRLMSGSHASDSHLRPGRYGKWQAMHGAFSSGSL